MSTTNPRAPTLPNRTSSAHRDAIVRWVCDVCNNTSTAYAILVCPREVKALLPVDAAVNWGFTRAAAVMKRFATRCARAKRRNHVVR